MRCGIDFLRVLVIAGGLGMSFQSEMAWAQTGLEREIITMRKVFPVAQYSIETGSNAVPLGFAARFAAGGYIDPQKMESYHSNLSENNRLGFHQKTMISLAPFLGVEKSLPQKPGFFGLRYVTESMSGARFTKDAFGLLMRGNTPFLGSEVKPGNNQIWSLSQRKLELHFNSVNKKQSYLWNVGLTQVVNYNHIRTKDLRLFSSSAGDSVFFDGNLYNQSTGRQPFGTGWGMQGGFTLFKNFVTSNGKVWVTRLDVDGFGFVSVNGIKNISRGAQWDPNSLKPLNWTPTNEVTLGAVNLNYSDLRAGDWIDRQRDSVEAKLNFQEFQQRGTFLSPFFANVQISRVYYKSNKLNFKQLISNVSYRHIIGYKPKVEIGGIFEVYKKLDIITSVSVGGFDVFDVNLSALYSYYIDVQLWGIESFVNPSKWHGGGISVMVKYPFRQPTKVNRSAIQIDHPQTL